MLKIPNHTFAYPDYSVTTCFCNEVCVRIPPISPPPKNYALEILSRVFRHSVFRVLVIVGAHVQIMIQGSYVGWDINPELPVRSIGVLDRQEFTNIGPGVLRIVKQLIRPCKQN